MAIAGAAVTGVYAACMSIVAFANPLMSGLGNSMMPRSVLAWKNGGGPALWHEAIGNAVLIAALMTAFSLAVLVAGEHVMHFLYHGTEYEGHGHTLTVLALAMFSGTLGAPASIALATMERPRAIVAAGAVGAAVTVGLRLAIDDAMGSVGCCLWSARRRRGRHRRTLGGVLHACSKGLRPDTCRARAATTLRSTPTTAARGRPLWDHENHRRDTWTLKSFLTSGRSSTWKASGNSGMRRGFPGPRPSAGAAIKHPVPPNIAS